jgi:RNA polymerase sigma factor (sigma-70 family)
MNFHQSESSDEDLLLGCQKQDEEAWALLVARYQRLIYSIPRRANLAEEDSAEILQRTFLKLLENLSKIKQPSQIKAWLVTTARRETLHFLRQQKALQTSLDDPEGGVEAISNLISAEPLADDVMLEMERQHRVRTAVTRLNERCRNLIVMLFYREEPPSYTEIASSLGISEGSIGPTRARCLQKLLELFNQTPKA